MLHIFVQGLGDREMRIGASQTPFPKWKTVNIQKVGIAKLTNKPKGCKG